MWSTHGRYSGKLANLNRHSVIISKHVLLTLHIDHRMIYPVVCLVYCINYITDANIADLKVHHSSESSKQFNNFALIKIVIALLLLNKLFSNETCRRPGKVLTNGIIK